MATINSITKKHMDELHKKSLAMNHHGKEKGEKKVKGITSEEVRQHAHDGAAEAMRGRGMDHVKGPLEEHAMRHGIGHHTVKILIEKEAHRRGMGDTMPW